MPIHPDKYGALASAFPSGVAVITLLGASGAPNGLAAQAISELSVDPPLVLVSVEEGSRTLPALQHSKKFVINFLKAGSEDVARRFASSEVDKFRGLRWERSKVADGAPILRDESVAYAECVIRDSHKAGDHWIFIASVEGGQDLGGIPLIHYRGIYTSWPNREPAPPQL